MVEAGTKANGSVVKALEKISIIFPLGDNTIDGAVIRPLTFKAFSDCVTEAQAMKQPATIEARLRRVRLVKQVSYYVNGSVAPVTMEDVLRMPIPTARMIVAKLDDDEGKAGRVIRAGDGIDKAIVYQLGVPLQIAQGRAPISELEFQASTYGDIEDVMAAPDQFAQTTMLIERIAKPLESTLVRLPSTALPMISLADGMIIMREVLPHFLGSPDE